MNLLPRSKVELKDTTDEDSYEALSVCPHAHAAAEERCLKNQFGSTKLKPLQFKIVS